MSDSIIEYQLPHTGLKKGIHTFNFELTEKFFAQFENALIQKCDIQATVTLDNKQEPYTIEIDLDGIIWNECDKCTAPIPLSIHASYLVYAKYIYDEILKDNDEMEIIYLTKDDQFINITQFLYDFVHLSIPAYSICDQPGKTEYCDKEIIKLLEKQQQEQTTDPRWADLDKLKDKLN